MTLIENPPPPPHFLINLQFLMSFSRSFLLQFVVLWVVGVAGAQTGSDFAVDGSVVGDSESTPPPFFR